MSKRTAPISTNSAAAAALRASEFGGEPAGTFSATINKTGTPLNAFLCEVVATTRNLPKFRHPEWPQLVPHQPDLPLHGSTVGTAFGWLLRLINDKELSTDEAFRGAFFLSSTRLGPPLEAFLEVQKLAERVAAGKRTPVAGEVERIAVVLGWYEEIYRGGEYAIMSSPLTKVEPHQTGAADLLELVPEAGVTHLSELGARRVGGTEVATVSGAIVARLRPDSGLGVEGRRRSGGRIYSDRDQMRQGDSPSRPLGISPHP
jgi:hypothetical protein